MPTLDGVPFSTIPILPVLYLILAPITTRSFVSSLVYISLGIIFLWHGERQRPSRGSDLSERQTDEVRSREISNHAKRYRKGKEISRAEKRILEDQIAAVIPDTEDRLRWYRERARELEMDLERTAWRGMTRVPM
jgi:hypothetical protein